MATRVFELARELDVTSKVILAKCRAEGLNIKNHMSTVSAGLEATIREWFSEEGQGTAVETSDHIDLQEARAQARKQRKRKKKEEEESQPEAEEAQEAPDETAGTQEPSEDQADQQEPQSQQAVAEAQEQQAPAEAQAAGHEPSEVTDAAPEEASAEPEEEAAQEPAPAAQAPEPSEQEQPEPATEEPVQAAAEKAQPEDQAQPESAEEPQQAESDEPDETQDSKDEDIKPAGPQVVPKPAALQGPRVVRVEKPDYIPPRRSSSSRSRTSSRPPQQAPPPPPTHRRSKTSSDQDEERSKGRGRRSPRRKSGRSADSGEKLKEWRNQDLLEREQRLAAAGSGLRRHRASVSNRGNRGSSAPSRPSVVEVEEPITVKSLSAAAGLKTANIIKALMQTGVLATVNQGLTAEQAELVCEEYGIELTIKKSKTAEEELLEQFESRERKEEVSRAPVVTFLGHVDHGKTSLLDRIRSTTVATGEAGGITQHIGAYRFDRGDSHVVFLDTPGHEAFTAMRSRGANMTDVVVLVVAADDGVMPQTVEAINHAKASGVPIVVALNKIDVPNANAHRAMGQLAEHELQPREWGGNTEVIQTSAETGDGIDDLIETLSLEAEILELKADPASPGSGYVIESEMDPGRGVVARLLVRDGTVRVGDILLAGRSYGHIRVMVDSHGRQVDEAGPATPVEVAGLDEMPEAGDRFFICESLDTAREIAEQRRHQTRSEELASTAPKTLESLFSKIESGQTNEVPLIIKADVQGSVEALVSSLEKLSTDEVRVNILHAAVGGVTAGDVTLAEASSAIIIGFNAVAPSNVRQMAEQKGLDIRNYRVIYDVLDDVRRAMEEGLAPEIREEALGRAEVRQVFKISRFGTVAGCYVQDGIASRNAKVRIIRENIVIEDERRLDSLKRFKEDAREVRAGMECGVKVAGYDDIKEGDVLEFYKEVEVARTL